MLRKLVEVACLVRHADHLPIAVSGGNLDAEDWGSSSTPPAVDDMEAMTHAVVVAANAKVRACFMKVPQYQWAQLWGSLNRNLFS